MSLTTADRLELHELAARYGDAIDDRDWNQLRAIFTGDAVFRIRHLDVTLQGIDEIIQFMATEATHPAAHLVLNVHVDPMSDGARVSSRVILPTGEDSGGAHRIRIGSYYDLATRAEGEWRVRSRLFSPSRGSDPWRAFGAI